MRTGLRAGETLVLECRRHWVVLLKPILLCAVAAPILLYLMLKAGSTFVTVILLILLAIPVAMLLHKILDRKYDIWAVTNLRVVDECGVFTTTAKESPLDKINNTTSRQTLLGRILGYGDVEIQTAAEEGETVYRLVTSPRRLADTITQCQEEYRQAQIAAQAQELARAINSSAAAAGGVDTVSTKECPFCAEIIKVKAKVCRFCGRELPRDATGEKV